MRKIIIICKKKILKLIKIYCGKKKFIKKICTTQSGAYAIKILAMFRFLRFEKTKRISFSKLLLGNISLKSGGRGQFFLWFIGSKKGKKKRQKKKMVTLYYIRLPLRFQIILHLIPSFFFCKSWEFPFALLKKNRDCLHY